MFCKNCGKNLGDSTNELCENCKELLSSNLVENEKIVENEKEVESNLTDSPVIEGVVNNTNNNNNTSNNRAATNNQNAKSKIAAGLFGIFLGAFGVHNFYLGYNGKAIGQLLLTLLSCFALSWISGIWGLIEGILCLTGDISTDANGVPLID